MNANHLESIRNIKLHITELRGEKVLLEQENQQLKSQMRRAISRLTERIEFQRNLNNDKQTLTDRSLNVGKVHGLLIALNITEEELRHG